MAVREFNGILLEDGEVIKEEVKLSKASIFGLWISIPAFLLASFAAMIIPRLLKTLFSSTFREALMDKYNVEEFSDINFSLAAFDLSFESIPIPKGLIFVSIALLILAWLGVCLHQTSKYSKCCLILTDRRVIGKSNGEELCVPLNEIVNVHLECSLLGRIFNHGNIVVQSKRKSVTFKNISDPMRMHKLLMSYAENYAAH